MKNLLLFLILSVLFSLVNSYSQDFWQATVGSSSYGKINAISNHPNTSGTLFAGTESGGILKSTDFGVNWFQSNSGLSASKVNRIYISSTTANIYAATSQGLYYSTNYGSTWLSLGLNSYSINSVTIASNGNILVGVWGIGVYRSTNNGVNWSLANTGLPTNRLVDALYKHSNGNLFAGVSAGSGMSGGIFRSTDNGDTWSGVQEHSSAINFFGLNKHNSDIYCYNFQYGYKSTDGGTAWIYANPPTDYMNDLLVNSTGNIYLATKNFSTTGNSGVFRSTNNGTSWTQVNSGLNNLDVYSLGILPDGTLFAGVADGGIYKSVSSTSTPTITISINSLPNFGNIEVGQNSIPQTYTVSGSNLISNITINAPTGFQLSLNGTSWTSMLTLTQSGGIVPSTTIYARFSPTLVQTYSGNITHTSTGATTQNVAVTGTGVPVQTPQISVTPQTLTFGNVVVNTNSTPQTLTVSGVYLTANIIITAPTGFQISLSSTTGYTNTLTLTQSGGIVPSTTIYVRFSPTLVQAYSGNIAFTSTGATTQNVAVTGTGVPVQTPQISVTPQTLTFGNVVVNTNSTPQTYTVSGVYLTANIIITAPTGFQISLSSTTGYTNTLTLTQSGGVVPTTTIYARFSPTLVQAYSGNIALTSTGATTQNVAVTGTGVDGCGPNWVPVQNQQYTMNMIAQLNFPEGLSTDINDAVGAFFGTECRGKANVTSDNGKIYLSISSNQASGETITFKAWRASTCEELPILETVVFQDNQIIGTYTEPFQFHAGLSTLSLSFNPLYTWFSINVDPSNMNLSTLFPSPPTNSKIIGQTSFAIWTGTSWVGSLTQIEPKKGYVMYVEQPYNVSVTGSAIDPLTNQISLGAGWNWVGYLPQDQLATSIALQNTSPIWVNNELIKSQTQFSIFSGGSWVGSLTTLNPGKGYKIQVSANKTLTYPGNTYDKSTKPPVKILAKQNDAPPNWIPIPNMQYSMNLIGKLQIGISTFSQNPNDILGAFVVVGVDTQCRGIQSPDPTSGLIFLSIGSNSASGEVVMFKAYRSDLDQVIALSDTFHFQDNRFIGIPDPYIFNTIVPVELLSFNANISVDKVLLNWSTATETNNMGFEIEKSLDQNSWTKLGFVSGKGTTTEISNYSYADNNCTNGLYYYRLKQLDYNGSFEYSSIISVNVEVPIEFDLCQNYPNPFNPSSLISYSLPKESFVIMSVYNILGDEVVVLVNEKKAAGNYLVEFKAEDLPSGIYFYRLQADNFIETKKMILLK